MVSMDFIEALPKSENRDTILVVVDKLTKYAYFIPLIHPYTALVVAKAFLNIVYKLHGMPRGIISDRDKVFTSQVWQDLFKLSGMKLHMSTAYHPQTDGQTERVNGCLETYLRCMCSHQPSKWSEWLPLAEWWYNTGHHSLGVTPFEALYGYKPPAPTVTNFETGVSPTVLEWKRDREHMLRVLRERLQEAQNRMKQNADRRRIDKEYTEGEMVYLKLQPYRQNSLAKRKNHKLTSKYYGPFEILQRVGPVAYRLQLPEDTAVHPVFHVSQLKKGIPAQVQAGKEGLLARENEESQVLSEQAEEGLPVAGEGLLPNQSERVRKGKSTAWEDDQLQEEPVKILERRLMKVGNEARTQVLVQWNNRGPKHTSWEDYWELKERYPGLDP